ncbi:MAG: penicillin acylase family protein [Cytophagaceae bacterium]|nr:penicillin acylase family protein [Gemmatimonadaceae bacterium]
MPSPAFVRTLLAATVVVAGAFALPTPPGIPNESSRPAPDAPETAHTPPTPQKPDSQTLNVPGLRAPVEVRRDRWGIPHIYAQNQHDLFLAQGFVVAQDRLFQMEMWRRQGEGRLAEILGPTAVERDRWARAFAYRGDMAREWAAYGPDTREIVRAFVAGVNAWIAQAGNDLPPEFTLLGFKPEPWHERVPLARATGLSGVGNGASEILRAQLVAAIGVERTEALMPTDPVRKLDAVAGFDYAGITRESLGGFAGTFADIAYTRTEGSNNWVVSGKRTATGRPILANDPHRVITNPAVRYISHLVAPGWNVIGAGEPASPGVAIGHNDRIAFGLTVVGMDQQDVYVEELRNCRMVDGRWQMVASGAGVGLNCYRHDGAWKRFRVIVDTIRVKGEAMRVIEHRYSVHGPVVSVDTVRQRAFAIRSIHSEPGTASYLASLQLDRARDWPSFQRAMTRWLMPSENMIYADVEGNIGWVAGGLMPRRSWSGMLPVPGDGRFEWKGFVPGMALPRAYNPAEGFIATANHNILPPGYTTPIAYEWATRYRIDRVKEVLGATTALTVEDSKRLQHDDLSKLAQALVPHLAAAATRRGVATRSDVAALVGWDMRMSREQVAPTIFSAWAPAAYRRVIAHALADQPRASALIGANTNYKWLEARLTKNPAGGAEAPAVDSLLLLALDDATADLTTRFGSDRAKWRWGAIHVAAFRHPLSSKYDLPAVSRGGDGNTVYATGGANFRQTSGASFREVIDLADFDQSVATNVPGQSGDPRSPHYSDLLQLWGEDRYFPLVFSRARVEQETEQVLWLRPVQR